MQFQETFIWRLTQNITFETGRFIGPDKVKQQPLPSINLFNWILMGKAWNKNKNFGKKKLFTSWSLLDQELAEVPDTELNFCVLAKFDVVTSK